MTRTLKRLIEGKISPEQFLPRLTMEELAALGAPGNALFVTFTDTDHCTVFYEVKKSRLTVGQMRAVEQKRRELGRDPRMDEMPPGFGITYQPQALATVAKRAGNIITMLQGGYHVAEGKWNTLKLACARLDGKPTTHNTLTAV